MKRLHTLLAALILLVSGLPAAAQISIDEVKAEPQDVKFRDELKSTSVDVDYFSLARYKAERPPSAGSATIWKSAPGCRGR